LDAGEPSRGVSVSPQQTVLHDLLGGELLIAKVYVDGAQRGHHAWNRLSGGIGIDLCRDQFGPDESIGAARVIERPANQSMRIQVQYELLRERVLGRLSADQE
jgi:hypothetical protein